MAVDLTELLRRRLLFVTGKGGTGKTTIAASLARAASARGLRTLVCDMDAKGDVARVLGVGPFQFQPSEVAGGLYGMAMDTEQSLREYLRIFVRLPLVTSIGPLASTLDFVADAAPGVKEVLAVGKLCWEVRENHFDLVIVDAEASGHIVSQIAAPRVLQRLVRLGLIRDQSDWMIEILEDSDTTGVVVVTTPEEMPVTETVALVARVRRETNVAIAGVIANRCPEPLFEGMLAQCSDASLTRREELVRRFGADAGVLVDMIAFHRDRRREAVQQLAVLHRDCEDVNVVVLPELGETSSIADDLAAILVEELA